MSPPATEGTTRVLMFGPVDSPHVRQIAVAMQREGHDVRVAGETWGGLPASSELDEAGIPVEHREWPTVVWMRRVLRRARPDVTHAHWLPITVRAALAGARPLVATAWGSDVYGARRRARLEARVLMRRADVVAAPSPALLEELGRLGAAPERSFLIGWGVDLGTFAPALEDKVTLRRRLGLGDGPLVLSPRAARPPYNPEVIVRAFRELAGEIADVQLVLKHMEDPAPDLGELPPRVHLVGRVPHERMADYYRAADVCVSIPSSDGSPRSVWEAMACGCPCVVSDLPWVPGLLSPGVHAVVVPIDDGALAGAVRRLLTDPAHAASVGAAGRLLVEQRYDRDREMRRLSALYRAVVDGRAG
jgi:glycosyltransferase involved in cell wall biosynthesis